MGTVFGPLINVPVQRRRAFRSLFPVYTTAMLDIDMTDTKIAGANISSTAYAKNTRKLIQLITSLRALGYVDAQTGFCDDLIAPTVLKPTSTCLGSRSLGIRVPGRRVGSYLHSQ